MVPDVASVGDASDRHVGDGLSLRALYHSLSGESQAFSLAARLAHCCNAHAIRLAARIWGTVVRHHYSTTSKSSTGIGLSRVALLHNSKPLPAISPPILAAPIIFYSIIHSESLVLLPTMTRRGNAILRLPELYMYLL